MNIKTLVSILNRQIEEKYGPVADKFGVSSVGLEILECLYTQDGRTPSELSKQIGRAATSFTPMLDKLADRGWVYRKPHPTDRRSVLVYLTPKGCDMKGDIQTAMAQADAEIRQVLAQRANGHAKTADFLDTLFAPLPAN